MLARYIAIALRSCRAYRATWTGHRHSMRPAPATRSTPPQCPPPQCPPRVPRPASRGRRTRGLLGLVLLSPVLLGAGAEAQTAKPSTIGEARDRRDQIKREQAEIAAQLPPLEATEDQLEQALNVITAHVQAQQARVNDANSAAEAADRRARDLARQVDEIERGIVDLERQVRERAVAAYVDPGGRNSNEELLLRSGDLTRAERQRALLDDVNGSDTDARDKLRAQRLRLGELRVEAEQAAVESAQRQADAKEELDGLAAAHAQQATIKAAIDERIASYKVHALELAKEDGDLERIISDLRSRASSSARRNPT